MPPTIQLGATGEWADYVRTLLSHYGYFHGAAQGPFNEEVQHALLQYQQACGMTTEHGYVGDATWALFGVTPATDMSAQNVYPTEDGQRADPQPDDIPYVGELGHAAEGHSRDATELAHAGEVTGETGLEVAGMGLEMFAAEVLSIGAAGIGAALVLGHAWETPVRLAHYLGFSYGAVCGVSGDSFPAANMELIHGAEESDFTGALHDGAQVVNGSWPEYPTMQHYLAAHPHWHEYICATFATQIFHIASANDEHSYQSEHLNWPTVGFV